MAKIAGSRSAGTSLDVDFENMVAVTAADEYRFLLWDLG